MADIIFPAELLTSERKDDALKFIGALPVSPFDRKRALRRWADFVGAVVEKKDVDEVTGGAEI